MKMIACPGCGIELPEDDTAAQVKHMEQEHPGLIAERLRKAGCHREAEVWEAAAREGQHPLGSRTLTIHFTGPEWEVLTQIASDSDITREEAMRQALRLLQLHRRGMLVGRLDELGGGCMGDDE